MSEVPLYICERSSLLPWRDPSRDGKLLLGSMHGYGHQCGSAWSLSKYRWFCVCDTGSYTLTRPPHGMACCCTERDLSYIEKREFFIDNLPLRNHFIIVMIRWSVLAPWEFEFSFPDSLTSTLIQGHTPYNARRMGWRVDVQRERETIPT